jgi:putative ABC transport system permease protein
VSPAYLRLSDAAIVLSALLILVNAAVSFLLRLGMERRLLVASLRTVLQLWLVGYVLDWVFTLNRWPPIVGLGLIMVAVAAVSAVNRARRRFPGAYAHSFASVLASSSLILGVTLAWIIDVRPWYTPQYLIPVLGMLLGNSLNGVSLGLDRLTEGIAQHRDRIEGVLALGGSAWEAAQDVLREAVRTGMIPTVNTMMVVGIVSLPGMMTGQILAGAAPTDAVRYQIMIMFLIASTTALGTLAIVLLGYRALFSPEHRLRFHRLTTARRP